MIADGLRVGFTYTGTSKKAGSQPRKILSPLKSEPMKIAIMQPYLFPYLGYWQLIASVDTFVIYDNVHYINKGYINRNYILVDAQAHRITLALIAASQNKLINEIEIGNNAPTLLKTIEMAYKRAPYFEEIFPLITSILECPEKNLAKFVSNSIQKISDFLEINTKFIYSSDIEKEKSLTAQEKTIHICKQLGASTYINAINGQKLYDKQWFTERGVELYFVETSFAEYKQFGHPFVPRLSIIDLLMFNSKEEIKRYIKNDYALI